MVSAEVCNPAVILSMPTPTGLRSRLVGELVYPACPHRVAKQLLAPTGLRSKTPWGWGSNVEGKDRPRTLIHTDIHPCALRKHNNRKQYLTLGFERLNKGFLWIAIQPFLMQVIKVCRFGIVAVQRDINSLRIIFPGEMVWVA